MWKCELMSSLAEATDVGRVAVHVRIDAFTKTNGRLVSVSEVREVSSHGSDCGLMKE
jgi:hypothetical protein